MQFAKASNVKKPKQLSVVAASLYLAGFFTIAAVLQLFAFESYPGVIQSYGLPFADGFALPLAALVVVLEVFAIPYLLWMKLSPPMRLVSMISGWLALAYWLGVGIWQGIVDFTIANAGLFGAKLLMPQGRWLVCYCAVLLILMIYVVWNMPPSVLRKKPLAKPTH
ncbi:MAG: rane protein of unknown function [Candidatus Saccharibacteria bacterium]|nr:rane protein of unknown function [Candidatus Saccharibacteria bacterium]